MIWKIIIASTRKDIAILNRQMRFVMPIGFLLIIIGVIMGVGSIDVSSILGKITSFPSVLFFVITIIGMALMMVFAFKLDGTKRSSNWIEQITNAIAQGCLLLGIISMMGYYVNPSAESFAAIVSRKIRNIGNLQRNLAIKGRSYWLGLIIRSKRRNIPAKLRN